MPLTPWLEDADVTLYHGNALATLRELPAESVDCVVTSPPYWGLRDYGTEGQLGLEPTPEQYVERMVEVFREVRRVLAPHGTVWLNLGDSYATTPTGNRGTKSKLAGAGSPAYEATLDRYVEAKLNRAAIPEGLKQKDLVGIPWRVAFALQADGWYLRSDIIWSKPNPMPESVTDRPTKAHEYVFLLSKQPRYFFDQEAVREAYEPTTLERNAYARTKHVRQSDGSSGGASYLSTKAGGERVFIGPTKEESWSEQSLTSVLVVDEDGSNGSSGTDGSASGSSAQSLTASAESAPLTTTSSGRNIRSVWEIATQPYPEAHFATFPEELARRCIAAGCPEQVCRVCGKARERVVERGELVPAGNPMGPKGDRRNHNPGKGAAVYFHDAPGLMRYERTDAGLTDCGHANYRPGIVLDPFMGSGTVAYVARKLGRHAVGIDLNESYLELAARRLQQQSLLTEIA